MNYVSSDWSKVQTITVLSTLNITLLLLTNDPVSKLTPTQLKDILLIPVVRKVFGLYLQGELLYKRTRKAGLGVWISIPSLLFYAESWLGEQWFDPSW